MKTNKFVRFSLLSLALAVCYQAKAEDIELYVNHNVKTTEKPRVVVVFDTSGSMAFSTRTGRDCGYYRGWTLCNDSRLGVAKDAIRSLVNENDDIEFGLMRFNGSSGGYVMAGLGATKTKLVEQINSLPADGSTPLTETLWEAYLYLTGQQRAYGRNVGARDRTVDLGYNYRSPFLPISGVPERCDNSVNVILMTDGDPSNDNGADNAIYYLHRNTFGSYPSRVSNSYLSALAKSIHGTKDTKVDLFPATPLIHDEGRVFAIGFGSGMSSAGKTLLAEAAKDGGGQYLHADTAEQLSDALKKTITRIREVNDTFSAPAVATNNADQTRSRESIYYAMFYPESGARWKGNLKKLRVSGANIVDSEDKQALNSDGLIDKNARTFWLPENEAADGNTVQQGGVNLKLSMLAERKLFTDAGTGGLIDFNYTDVANALGGVNNLLKLAGGNLLELPDIISWSKGVDVNDENNNGSSLDQRPDIFGDPLHSKPVAIDYGNNDIRILIGTNAGYLHMFKDSGDTVSESWAFIPTSLYKVMKPLRDNQADTKVYGFDGPISIYFDDKNKDGIVNGSDRVWAFTGMRRGGNQYYAFDISIPDKPKLMWGGPITGSSGDFNELGQTWSKAQVAFVNLNGYKNKPMLIFGAGYDTNKDNAIRSNDSKGRGIFIVDAQTGKKVWSLESGNGFQGQHSIASDITTMDSDYDGYIDRLYATDTGGNVWRVDMPSDNPTDAKNPWTHFKLAELGSNSAAQDRRFFYKPMVARTMFSKVTKDLVSGVTTRKDTPFDAVLIGSGNRSKPTSTSEQDQLFMIRDENTVTRSFKTKIPPTIEVGDLMKMNDDPFGNSLDNIEKFVELEAELANSYKGWRYALPSAGEKSLAAATVIGGVAYFTSYTPASKTSTVNQCSLSGGSGHVYAFHLHYGTKAYSNLKYQTGNDVPDTPQIFFGSGASCADSDGNGKCDDTGETVTEKSRFQTIGPSIKNPEKYGVTNPFVPKEIIGPGLNLDKDGKIKLFSDELPIGFGFKTRQTFIYKREDNDEASNDN